MSDGKRKAQQASAKVRDAVMGGKQRVEEQVGGPARLRIILVLGAILGLDTADKATVSAVAGNLKNAFDIGNTEIGLLVSAVSFVGALATLPVGILVDRMHRKRILIAAIALWAVAMVLSGTATSYLYLLLTRIFLGAVAATATPAVASLTGDFFPARQRARVYGLILAGELVGTGFGFVVSGLVASWINWRWAFFSLALTSTVMVWIIWRYLPEPARGGQSWLQPNQNKVHSGRKTDTAQASSDAELARESVRRAQVEPREELLLDQDPKDRSLWWSIRYVLRIPTYVYLVIASALGYYFFSGARAFLMIYLTQHYDLSSSSVSGLILVVGIGALIGVVSGGRIAERLLHRGQLSARIIVPGVALFSSTLFFAPGIWTNNAAFGVTMFTFGAAALAAANPPLDAARLDIMHPRLWGRAESIRTTLRMFLEGIAPTLFGFVSSFWFSGGEHGLMSTLLLMLLALPTASSLAIFARRSYPRDVATAGASVERLSK